VQHQLAKRAHDEEDDHAGHGVGEDQPRPSEGDRPARAEEEPHANRAAERDELHVAILQSTVKIHRLLLLFSVNSCRIMRSHVGYSSGLLFLGQRGAARSRGRSEVVSRG
jgi:hypothetical protein